MGAKIIGCGGYLPEKILTNNDLANIVDTNDEWIRTRTGITQRHICAPGEHTSHMAHRAALDALGNAGIDKDDIDLVIVCTNTPDNSFPSVSNKLQGLMALGTIPSFDIQSICGGFIYGLHVADNMLKSGAYKTILLVCADKMSSLLDWNDRSTCVLFGDGAGAVILQQTNSNSEILDSNIYSDGSMYDILYADGGVGSTGKAGTVQMKGQEVFRKAVEKMSESVLYLLDKNSLSLSDIDFFIPHQANLRIIDNIASRFKLDPSKVVTTVETHANCSAASIPLALWDLNNKNAIKRGDILAFTAFGAGASWGAALIRW